MKVTCNQLLISKIKSYEKVKQILILLIACPLFTKCSDPLEDEAPIIEALVPNLNGIFKTINNGLQQNLTRRTHDVLVAISEELTAQQISEKLFISPKTVETHRMNMMSKLGAKYSVELILVTSEAFKFVIKIQ